MKNQLFRVAAALAFAVCTNSSFAQLDLVPQKCFFVAKVNQKNIGDKVGMEEWKKTTIYKEMMQNDHNAKGVYELIDNPSAAGISTDKEIVFFSSVDNEKFLNGFIFSIKDDVAFEKFISSEGHEMLKSRQGNVNTYQRRFEAFSWDKNKAVMLFADYFYSYDYVEYPIDMDGNIDDETYYQLQDQKREEREKERVSAFGEIARNFIANAPKENLIGTNKSFAQFAKSTDDVALWIDQSAMTMLSGMAWFTRSTLGAVSTSLNSTYLHFYANFEKGKMVGKQVIEYPAEAVASVAKIYAPKPQDALFDFFSANKGFAYFASSIDPKEAVKYYIDDIEKTFESYAQAQENKEFIATMSLIEMLLDEQRIAGITNGQMILSFNGMHEYEYTYQTYTYDENYNYMPVDKTISKKDPLFTFAMGIGNLKDAQKLVKILDAYKILKPIESRDGWVFYAFESYSESSPTVHLAHNKEWLFITNDKSMISKDFKVGYAKTLDKKRVAQLKQSNFNFFLDVDALDKAVGPSKRDPEAYVSPERNMLENLKKHVSTIEMGNTTVQANKVTSTFSMEMKNKNAQSFLAILELFAIITR